MNSEKLMSKPERWWFELEQEEKERLAKIYHSTDDISSLSKFDIEELYDDYMLTEKIRHEELLEEWSEWEDELEAEEDYYDAWDKDDLI